MDQFSTDLNGKRALVGGASKGIGRAAAEALARKGATVTVIARSADKLEEVKSGLDTSKGQIHHALVADFSKPDELKQIAGDFVTDHGPVHILVNNSGGPAAGPIHTAKAEDFMAAFTQHLIGNHIMTQAVLESMKALGYGRIINVISTSVKQPIAGLGVSNTIRGAVGNWAKTLAGEVGKYGITVNNVLPGATSTDRLQEIMDGKAAKQGVDVADVIRAEKSHIPAERFAEPRELGEVIAFLASGAASYINGINVPVDGGRTKCL